MKHRKPGGWSGWKNPDPETQAYMNPAVMLLLAFLAVCVAAVPVTVVWLSL